MITVIRVEHVADELGVWRSCDINENARIEQHSNYWEIKARHENPEVFPNYGRDHALGDHFNHGELPERYFFAFKTIEQLKVAFTVEELKELITMGFDVLMLDVTDYKESPFQVVFTKKSIVNKKIINSLFQ
jgi:hypothetical protein